MFFCATTSHDLNLWPFDLESVSCTVLLMYDPRSNFCYRNFQPGQKIVHIFLKSQTLICLFTLSLSGATTKIKTCYRRKLAFSHYEGYNVYSVCSVSRGLCIESPQNHIYLFFLSQITYILYTFYGSTTTIKGSLYWGIPMLKSTSWTKYPPVATHCVNYCYRLSRPKLYSCV